MPQDSLWAASARSIGFRAELLTTVGKNHDQTLFTFAPLWSKEPATRPGIVCIEVPTYATWETPVLFNAAFEQWLGGDPKHVPAVVRHAMQGVRQGYREGSLPAG